MRSPIAYKLWFLGLAVLPMGALAGALTSQTAPLDSVKEATIETTVGSGASGSSSAIEDFLKGADELKNSKECEVVVADTKHEAEPLVAQCGAGCVKLPDMPSTGTSPSDVTKSQEKEQGAGASGSGGGSGGSCARLKFIGTWGPFYGSAPSVERMLKSYVEHGEKYANALEQYMKGESASSSESESASASGGEMARNAGESNFEACKLLAKDWVERMDGLKPSIEKVGEADIASCGKKEDCKKQCKELKEKLAKANTKCRAGYEKFKSKCDEMKTAMENMKASQTMLAERSNLTNSPDTGVTTPTTGGTITRSIGVGSDDSSGSIGSLNFAGGGSGGGAPLSSNGYESIEGNSFALSDEKAKEEERSLAADYDTYGGEGSLGSLGTDYSGAKAGAIGMDYSPAMPGEMIGTSGEARLPNGAIDPRRVYTVGKLRMVRQVEMERNGKREVVLVDVNLVERNRRRLAGVNGSRLNQLMKRAEKLNLAGNGIQIPAAPKTSNVKPAVATDTHGSGARLVRE